MDENKMITEKQCTKCGIIKPISDYYYHKLRGKIVPQSNCKTCTIEMVKKYKENHPIDKDKAKETWRLYYAKNRDEILSKCKLNYPQIKEKVTIHNAEYYQSHRADILYKRVKYREENKEKIAERAKKYYYYNPDKNKKKYIKHRSKILEREGDRRLRIKTEVISYYGNNKCACVKCGFTDLRALTIDHINGNGAEHRKENKYMRGNHVYEWLKRNKYPIGYQTLCMNCQLIKRQENHECVSKKKTIDKTLVGMV